MAAKSAGRVKVLEGSPPPCKSNRNAPTASLPAVRAAGGKWCQIAEYPARHTAGQVAYMLRNRLNVGDRFEFVSRTVGDKGVVYARLKVEGKS